MAPAFSKRPGQQIATRDDGLSYALATGEPPRVMRKATKAHHPDDHERWEAADYTNTLTGHGATTSEIVDGIRRLTPTECERLQGFPDGWTEPESDSTRYRMLGNAVCVPVAEWIGRRMR